MMALRQAPSYALPNLPVETFKGLPASFDLNNTSLRQHCRFAFNAEFHTEVNQSFGEERFKQA